MSVPGHKLPSVELALRSVIVARGDTLGHRRTRSITRHSAKQMTYQTLFIFDFGRLGTMNGSHSATHPALFAVAEFLAIDMQNWNAAVEAANKYKSAQKTN
jgi:hypothetical protein